MYNWTLLGINQYRGKIVAKFFYLKLIESFGWGVTFSVNFPVPKNATEYIGVLL